LRLLRFERGELALLLPQLPLHPCLLLRHALLLPVPLRRDRRWLLAGSSGSIAVGRDPVIDFVLHRTIEPLLPRSTRKSGSPRGRGNGSRRALETSIVPYLEQVLERPFLSLQFPQLSLQPLDRGSRGGLAERGALSVACEGLLESHDGGLVEIDLPLPERLMLIVSFDLILDFRESLVSLLPARRQPSETG